MKHKNPLISNDSLDLSEEEFSMTSRIHDCFENMLALMHPYQNPKTFGNEIRFRFPSPHHIFFINPSIWRSIGVSEHDILLFKHLVDITRYVDLSAYEERPKLCHFSLVSPYLIRTFFGLDREYSYLLCLNRHGLLKEQVLLQTGTEDGTLFSLRDLLQEVVRVQPTALIMCHNHPHGTLRPSPEDIDCTYASLHALSALRIPLLDHVIVAGNHAVSLRENGFIPESYWMYQAPDHWMLEDWFLDEESSLRKRARKK